MKQGSPDFLVLGKVLRVLCSCNHESWYTAAAATFFSGHILSILLNSKLGSSEMSAGSSHGRNSALSPCAPCWNGACGEAKQGMAVTLGRHASGQILTQGLVHIEAASDFHRRMERGISIAPEKTAVALSVPVREGQWSPCSSVAHASYCNFLAQTAKFSCLENVQFLKLRVFLSKAHKICHLEPVLLIETAC